MEDIGKKIGFHQGERLVWAHLGVSNKAVSSIQSCPLASRLQLLSLAEARLLWGQQVLKDSHQPSRGYLSGWDQPSWWFGLCSSHRVWR